MSDFQFEPWSNNPNAPKIPYGLYLLEKLNFAGILIGSILYGTCRISPPTRPAIRVHCFVWLFPGLLTVLFFKCITVLFDPVHRRGAGIKWGLVSFTLVMFSLATVRTAISINFLSISYIDNRDYPGVEGEFAPGPVGYQGTVSNEPINVIPYAIIPLNSWLADGLLVRIAAFVPPGA